MSFESLPEKEGLLMVMQGSAGRGSALQRLKTATEKALFPWSNEPVRVVGPIEWPPLKHLKTKEAHMGS